MALNAIHGKTPSKIGSAGASPAGGTTPASEPAGITRERLLAVSHGLKGELSLDEITRAVDRSRATIQNWFDTFRKSGVDGLCAVACSQRRAKGLLSAVAAKELRKSWPREAFAGQRTPASGCRVAFGIEAKTHTVLKWLGKLAARLKVVRPRHPRSSEVSRYEFRHQLGQRHLQSSE